MIGQNSGPLPERTPASWWPTCCRSTRRPRTSPPSTPRSSTATRPRPDLDFEFVYVNDGSTDASLERLLELRAADPRVTVLSLSRNCGHQIAVTAGLDAGAPTPTR